MKSVVSLLLLFCFTNTSFLFSNDFPEWKWLNPLPQGNSLNDIFLLGDDVWMVGHTATIIKNNQQWTDLSIQHSVDGLGYQLNSVWFLDRETGYAVGHGGLLIKTKDGGKSWHRIPLETKEALFSIQFVSDNIGYIAGLMNNIYKTVDGGLTWTRLENDLPYYYSYLDMCWLDENRGWLGGESQVLIKTTDGGKTWEQLQSAIQGSFQSVFFVNDTLGWLAGGSAIYKTVDGGSTLELSYQWYDWDSFPEWNSLYFLNENHGWAAGGLIFEEGQILVTEDGGTTWEHQECHSPYMLSTIKFSDENNGFAVGDFGTILKTNNGGKSWDNLSQNILSDQINSIFFTDEYNGWAVAAYNIWTTNDGGQTWSISHNSEFTLLLIFIFQTEHTAGPLAQVAPLFFTPMTLE